METTTLGTLGMKMVNLYVPGTFVYIEGISGAVGENGQRLTEFVIYRTSVEWVETDQLDVTAGLLQTLTLLPVDDNGDDMGMSTVSVMTHMYDIVVI